ncbi:MAG: PepSY-associated TM helix domain-containing protein [Blastochloris sp.]|nr:PepSY-associated TM helix domain-containing protein [Blastochloris sp.]
MNKKILRNLHRWLGLTFSLFVFLAAGSGVLHNIMSMTQKPPPKPGPSAAMKAEDFHVSPVRAAGILPPGTTLSAVSIREIAGEPWYQLYPSGKKEPVYVNARSGEGDSSADARYAAQIASGHLRGLAVRKTDYLTEFNAEYISIFRILPVYRFDVDDGKGTRVYVSTMTGSVTRTTDDWKQFEANVFRNFHKFAFIPDKEVRNWVLTFTTSAIALVALLGVYLFLLSSKNKNS